MAERHFPEVSTESAPQWDYSLHQAACGCGWRGALWRDWDKALEEVDRHIERTQPNQKERK